MSDIQNDNEDNDEVWHADGKYAKLNRPSPEFEKLKKFIQANPNVPRRAILDGFDSVVTPDDVVAARRAIVDEGGPPTGAGTEKVLLRKRAEARKKDQARVDQERSRAAIVPNLDTRADLTEPTRDKPTEDPLEFAQRVMDAALRNATTGQLLAELQRRHGGVGVA